VCQLESWDGGRTSRARLRPLPGFSISSWTGGKRLTISSSGLSVGRESDVMDGEVGDSEV